MLIAFFSDIHGNIDALNAAVDHAYNLKIKKFICLGDYVGYYYWPEKCIKKLNQINGIMIKGNHEDILYKITKDFKYKEYIEEKYGNGHNIAIKKLSKSQIDFLHKLSNTKTLNLPNNLSLKICHGSPNSIDEYLYPNTDKILLDKLLEKDSLIACGHTHYQMKYINEEKKIFFNPGSIGQPRLRGTKGACWASLCTETKKVKFHDTPYDKSKLLRSIEINDPKNNFLKDVLLR